MKLASSQPDIFPFATVTGSCKEANFMGFSYFIYENERTSDKMYLPMYLAKKSQFNFSFFKVDSQNLKVNLEYLNTDGILMTFNN